MPRTVRGALLQASWTGDKESMIQKHEGEAHEAAKQGAQFILFQELFYGPYFCQVQDAQYYSYTEHIPDGPTTKRMQDLAKQTGMVLVVPMYEEDDKASGIYYNTAAVIDSDGKYLGKYRKTHIPHVKGFWEKFYFRPGNLGYPVFETAVGKVGVYICYDRHFPEGARALGLNGAEMVFIPSATSRGLSEYLWRIEQVSHAVANGYFVGTITRVGSECATGDDDCYGQSYCCDPRGQFIGDLGSAQDEELLVRDMDLDKITEVRQTWQFYRDRRPDAYDDLVRPSRATKTPRARPDAGRPVHPQAREHDRADDRPGPPGRGRRLRVRLALRLARALAGPVPAPDADGGGHRPAPSRDVRHEPRHPRAERDRVKTREPLRRERQQDGSVDR